jgi:large subunit ribosomal protein L21
MCQVDKTMYAIIKTGGKQYRVSPGQTLRVEKLDGAVGDTVELGDVLLVGGEGDPRIGTPQLSGVAVNAEIVEQGRAKKIIVYKKKRRKGYHKKQGHRQYFTGLRITEIRS